MDEHKSFLENLKGMTWSERLRYFSDYYLVWTIGGVLLAAFLIYMIWGYTHMPADEVMYAFVFSDLFEPEKKAEAARDIAGLLSVEEGQVLLDDGHEVGDDGDMQIAVLFASREVDIVICPMDEFERLAGEGAFLDLAEMFDAEQCEKWRDRLVKAHGYVEQDLSYSEDPFHEAGQGMGEERVYGIMISEGERYRELTLTGDELVCGIVANSQYPENGKIAIEYFMGATENGE